MMRTYRPLQIGSLIQRELNNLIVKELEFPLETLATLSNIEVSPDLSWAKIGVSVIPMDAGNAVMKIFNKSRGHLQYLLNRKLNIKPMPKIEFEIDYGLENAAKIEELLLKKEASENNREQFKL